MINYFRQAPSPFPRPYKKPYSLHGPDIIPSIYNLNPLFNIIFRLEQCWSTAVRINKNAYTAPTTKGRRNYRPSSALAPAAKSGRLEGLLSWPVGGAGGVAR
jgi:hypothetical protein